MKCPKCGSMDTVLKDSRKDGYYQRRKRACKACGHKFKTIEYYVPLWAEKMKEAKDG